MKSSIIAFTANLNPATNDEMDWSLQCNFDGWDDGIFIQIQFMAMFMLFSPSPMPLVIGIQNKTAQVSPGRGLLSWRDSWITGFQPVMKRGNQLL